MDINPADFPTLHLSSETHMASSPDTIPARVITTRWRAQHSILLSMEQDILEMAEQEGNPDISIGLHEAASRLRQEANLLSLAIDKVNEKPAGIRLDYTRS